MNTLILSVKKITPSYYTEKLISLINQEIITDENAKLGEWIIPTETNTMLFTFNNCTIENRTIKSIEFQHNNKDYIIDNIKYLYRIGNIYWITVTD